MQFPANQWRTSSYSGDQGQCVEVAVTNSAVGVRDSKDRDTGQFAVPASAWSAFTRRVKTGQFDG